MTFTSNDLLISLAVKPVGVFAHGKAGTVRRDIVWRLACGSVPAAFVGALLLIGIVGGLLVGMTSVGSGSLMLVLLSLLYPTLSSRSLVGTDLAQAIPLVASAVAGHLLFGDIRLSIVLPVLLGALPGVWLGSHWSVKMPDHALRPMLMLLVGASGLRLVGVL